jgi:hypothetical protein
VKGRTRIVPFTRATPFGLLVAVRILLSAARTPAVLSGVVTVADPLLDGGVDPTVVTGGGSAVVTAGVVVVVVVVVGVVVVVVPVVVPAVVSVVVPRQ